MTALQSLVDFSNRYGANPSLVLAGGGNTSAKENGVMFVKGSGTRLATITAEQFVKMELDKLLDIFNKDYPENDDEREALVLNDLMAARAPGEGSKRPSVETMLHGIFEQKYVLHLHPALVNGLTCSAGAAAKAAQLFGEKIIWVDACKPGYILSKICFDKMTAFKKVNGAAADMLLLQNHGIFIADDTVDGLGKKLDSVISILSSELKRKPSAVSIKPDTALLEELKSLCGGFGEALTSADSLSFCESKEKAAGVLRPFTPDHIVYCKAYPLWLGKNDSAAEKIKDYSKFYGFLPRIIIAEGRGIFALGSDEKQAATAKLLFDDAVNIAVYSESFGGPLPMSAELTDFIVNWEVESYRSSQNK